MATPKPAGIWEEEEEEVELSGKFRQVCWNYVDCGSSAFSSLLVLCFLLLPLGVVSIIILIILLLCVFSMPLAVALM